ncbi:MAG: hypothetical protein HOP20_09755 [Sulfuriferula sp.]|nr:hypothetical protein [Sulfuriferula sp.]
MTYRLITLVLLMLWTLPAAAFNAAFFYGTPFIPELRIYDAIIVEPDQPDFVSVPASLQGKLYAYTSLGEVGADKPYAKSTPNNAKMTRNTAWSSDVMDQTSPVWQQFYIDKIVAPLWQRGYRGIFIDTLDSYQLAATTPAARTAQEAGMIATIRQLKVRFPGIRIILNRGFEILPQVHNDITAVVAESLFQGWDNANHRYTSVSDSDRSWLSAQLNKIKTEYKLPVIVIDYAAPNQRTAARNAAQKIRSAGFIPWVSNPELDMLGVGSPEIQPRRVLMLYDGRENKDPIYSDMHRYGAMPIQHLGYVTEYHDLSLPLPTQQLAGQYAGIVLWSGTAENSVPLLKPWLLKQIKSGIRLAVINEFGFERSRNNLQAFGLTLKDSVAGDKVSIVKQDAIVGFEHKPEQHPNTIDIIQSSADSTPILALKVGNQTTDVAAYTPWGGYVLSPYAILEIPYQQGTRWIINPFAFFKHALDLPDMPAPDVTTSTGRRLLMAHMDGDGFANNAEFPGSPLAPRVMLDKIFKKYTIPTAVSVIEAETAPWGLYPKKSAEMEQIAREIYRLPHVEIASHSYSHPFKWQALKEGENEDGEGLSLSLPGYKFSLDKEINGSVGYINQRLAPAGKVCTVFLWTGDCNPGADALAKTDAAGLLNMNGGETTMTNSQPSVTFVSPLGVARDASYQIYAPNQNENVYTNNWLGPYYGYRRVIETFQLTDKPRRLKPVDIYFHTYAASKPASLKALEDVYDYALKQPNHPVYPSDYIRRVLDFNQIVMAREDGDWLFYGDGQIDTLRIKANWGYPSNADSVAGYQDYNQDRYLNLTKSTVNRVQLTPQPSKAPYLVDANGVLKNWVQHSKQTDFTLNAYVKLDFTLNHADTCRLYDAQGQVMRTDNHTQQQYHYQTHAAGQHTYKLSC